jgi:glyoxylase-like metal-dependent hydrolase (beta-lactamase superfamily II)
MIDAKPYEIRSIITGTVALDGGAMFGVVPKALWSSKFDADDENRILLASRSLLAVDRQAGRAILVDTGCGTKWEAKLRERYGISDTGETLPQALAEADLRMEDITDVVISHLHFDHNGGLTEWVDRRGGPTRLRFPQARHWVHEQHWAHAPRTQPSRPRIVHSR